MRNNGGNVPDAESYVMKGGDGTYSYMKNSSYQRIVTDAVKGKIEEAIEEKLDIKNLISTSKTFCIADFGCSVGPNTFTAMQNIVVAVGKKYQDDFGCPQLPEFQVFFNDQASNDFNILFSCLPPDGHYFAAGVPGSFYGRLFPESSLHFAYSSMALHWLSKVPEELLDQNSPAWNKGKIHYINSNDEVVNAYASEFARSMENFLNARAKELVTGGMMVLNIPARPSGVPLSQTPGAVMYADFLESSFIEMVNEGLISEAQVDSFNLPVYIPAPEELQELLGRNGSFKIEKMELTNPTQPRPSEFKTNTDTGSFGQKIMMHMRAGLEGIIGKHFGAEIIDELFDRYQRKLDELPHRSESTVNEGNLLFVVLTKCK